MGGGKVDKLKKMPPRSRMGDNENAFTGGFRMWGDDDKANGEVTKD